MPEATEITKIFGGHPELFPGATKHSRVLIVDDDDGIRDILRQVLIAEQYEVMTAANGLEALDIMSRNSFDLIMTDAMMPRLDGYELIRTIKENPLTRLIPCVMVTALDSRDAWVAGITVGADDFLTKPIDHIILLARVKSLTSLKRFTDELVHAQEVIYALARTVELRDGYTLGHSERVNGWSRAFAQSIGFVNHELLIIDHASILHDIGKIGVPDSILQKNGPLDSDEWVVMRQHPEVGAAICSPLKMLEPVLPLIRSHQERWNGTGYPDGLSGDDIPIGAQLIATVDAWDALITDRPYRKGMEKKTAIKTLERETENGLWQPELINLWLSGVTDNKWGL
ncbi:MAG: response regulator [bacterium]|nr:response regulator [bacterium]